MDGRRLCCRVIEDDSVPFGGVLKAATRPEPSVYGECRQVAERTTVEPSRRWPWVDLFIPIVALVMATLLACAVIVWIGSAMPS